MIAKQFGNIQESADISHKVCIHGISCAINVNPSKASPQYTQSWGLWEMCVIANSNGLHQVNYTEYYERKEWEP